MRPNFSYLVSVICKDHWDPEAFILKEYWVKNFSLSPITLNLYGRSKITEFSLLDVKEFHVKVYSLDNSVQSSQDYDFPFSEVENHDYI